MKISYVLGAYPITNDGAVWISAILGVMNQKMLRAIVALVLALAAGGAGYSTGANSAPVAVSIPAQTVSAPAAGSVRVVYSLDQKQNDKEIIALIDGAKEHIYFAIYTFTLPSIADALVAAKKRGVLVRGIIDVEQSSNSYGAPITEKLLAAGIPIVTQKHATGNGIMHIKTLVTESAYATGSYNWTKSATTINDEILEIGTDPALRQAYENILKKLLDAYRGNSAAAGAAAPVFIGPIDNHAAPKHIREPPPPATAGGGGGPRACFYRHHRLHRRTQAHRRDRLGAWHPRRGLHERLGDRLSRLL